MAILQNLAICGISQKAQNLASCGIAKAWNLAKSAESRKLWNLSKIIANTRRIHAFGDPSFNNLQKSAKILIALFHRAKRGSRHPHPHARPIIKRNAHRAQVWKRTPFGFVVCVTDIIAHHRGFPAKKTSSCHFLYL